MPDSAEAVCESGVGISAEQWEELETEGEPAVLDTRGRRILKRHIHRQFFTRGIYLAAHLTEAAI